ncbi:MAG: RecX family transcriptional regulator [Muribaculaceae bacterium]|nr:RecX family transcriptional regulator [Muribaculaceae bacterium]
MEQRKKKRQPSRDEMLLRMAGLCAASEQCVAGVREKILKAGLTPDDAEAITRYLMENKYIDDSRFARAFAADKVRFAGWGKFKIRMALRMKGIADSYVADALSYINEKDYAEALSKAIVAKARQLNLSDVADRQRLYRHLASRGFESHVIIPAIREYMRTNL